MSEDSGTIQVPKWIIEQIRLRLPLTDFRTVDEYATYVLEEVLSHVSDDANTARLSEDDEKIVRERLKKLGYFE